MNLQRACSYFELRDPARHYDHLVCTGCGKVVLLDLPCPVEQYSERLQSTYGFRADGHSLEFFGQCRECVV